MNFLDKLNFLMEQKGINKKTLSKESGIPYTTIDGFYKKGYNNAKLSTIKKLSSYFNVSLDYLMGDLQRDILMDKYSLNFNLLSQKDLEIIKKYPALDEHGKKIVDLVINCEYQRCYPVKIEKLIAKGHDSDKPIEVEIRTDIEPIPTDDEF